MIKILQIMPADGWCIIVLYDDKTVEKVRPLVGWALCEDTDGTTWVTGCVVDDKELTWQRIAEAYDPDYVMYLAPGQTVKQKLEEAEQADADR